MSEFGACGAAGAGYLAAGAPAAAVVVLGLTLAAGVAGDDATGAAWSTFTTSDQRLSVSMPGVPKSKQVKSSSFIGNIITHEYYVSHGRDAFSVEFSDIPAFAVNFSGAADIYEHARGALLNKTFSKATSFTDVAVDGIQGKRLVYDAPIRPGHPEMQGEARFFLVEDRLYTVDAVVEAQAGEQVLRRFFSSLQIKR